MPPWYAAFACAALLAVAAVPLLRRLALATQFVDVPDRRKVHPDPVPYLGGVAIMLAVLTGMLFDTHLSGSGGVLLLGAILLGTMGLIDDDRHLDPNLRLLAEVAAACVALAVGMRIHASGVTSLDLLLTLLWIVGVTNAFNLMDNMDGLAAGIAAAAASALFVLAVFASQTALATLAAATVGACIGFLVYNRPPASIFMGDAGSLFLGFVLAVLTIDVDPNLGVPFSFAVPLILLALPVLDTTTVTLARLRRRRPVWLGGRDHLSHRLVRRGFSRRGAVGFLLGVQVTLAALAVLGGRHVIPLWSAVVGSAAVLTAVAGLTLRVPVYVEPVKGLPAGVRLAVVAGVLAVPALAGPALAAMLRASQPAREAATVAEAALDALAAGDNVTSQANFQEAARRFAALDAQLSGTLTSLGLAVPGVAANLDAARALVKIGGELSETGTRLAAASDRGRLPIHNGQVSLPELERIRPLVAETAEVLHRAQRRLAAIERGFLVPPLAVAVVDLRSRIDSEVVSADRAARTLQVLPNLLGQDGPKRYFLAFQNNTELRGSGGLIGNWGELVAENGRISLSRFGRLEELIEAGRRGDPPDLPTDFVRRWSFFDIAGTWQNVNVSPDFPTTGKIVSEMYAAAGGAPIDGVIAIDPPGLASLLELTGPVTVAGWPEPVTAANVVDITLRDAYARYPIQEERVVFLGELARRVTEAFTSADLGTPPLLARAVSQAARDKHLLVYLRDAQAQKLVTELGADGAVPQVNGDSLMVVQQNISANKVDYYLRRTIRYDLRIDPSRRPATATGSIDVELANGAPPQGLPEGVIGPYDTRFAPGENRAFISVYSPLAGPTGTLDGEPLPLQVQRDLGRPVRSAAVSLPALSTRTLSIPVKGTVRLGPQGWYRLDIPHQPTLSPDNVIVSVAVPDGWRTAEVRGARREGNTRVVAEFQQTRNATIWLRIDRTGWAGLWDKLMGRG